MLTLEQIAALRLSQQKRVSTEKACHALIDKALLQIQFFQIRDEGIKARASSSDFFPTAEIRSDEIVHVPGLRFGEETTRAVRWAGIKLVLEALKKDECKSDVAAGMWIMVDSLLSDPSDELFPALLGLVDYLEREKAGSLTDIKFRCEAHRADLKVLDATGGHSFPISYHGKASK